MKLSLGAWICELLISLDKEINKEYYAGLPAISFRFGMCRISTIANMT
jgi:hypothetical protein